MAGRTGRAARQQASGPGPCWPVAARSRGQPSRLRLFDPARIADLEYRAWTGYYRRNWPQVLAALAGLVRAGFGMDWYSTLHGAWLLLRASQLWAPVSGNDPAGARACMQRFYALVKLSCGEPASPAQAAALELDWWRVHRQIPYATGPRGAGDELVESVTQLYCYLYGEREAAVRPAASTGPARWTCPTSGSRRAAARQPAAGAAARGAGARLRRPAGRRPPLRTGMAAAQHAGGNVSRRG